MATDIIDYQIFGADMQVVEIELEPGEDADARERRGVEGGEDTVSTSDRHAGRSGADEKVDREDVAHEGLRIPERLGVLVAARCAEGELGPPTGPPSQQGSRGQPNRSVRCAR